MSEIRKTHKKVRRYLFWMIGILSVALLGYGLLIPKAVQVEVTQVRRMKFQETVLTDGVLRSINRHTVTAFGDGIIKRIDLKVGDLVNKGQVITELYWNIEYEPVRSPMRGVISKVYRESDGPIHRGEPLVEVIDPQELEVVAEVLTSDATRIKKGNSALVKNWGGPEALRAQVHRISQAGFVKQSALGVEEERTEVTLNLGPTSNDVVQHLGSTYHVDIEIEVSRNENALVIPEGAVFRDRDHWATYLVSQGKAKKVDVLVMARGNGWVSLRDGLREGQEVVVFPGDLVSDGVKLKPQR